MSTERTVGILFANHVIVPYYYDMIDLTCLIFSSVLAIFGIAGATILAIVLAKQIRSPSAILLLCLMIYDLMFQLSRGMSFFAIIISNGWHRGVCVWSAFFNILSSGGIYISLILIAVERCLSICHSYHISTAQLIALLSCSNIAIVVISIVAVIFADTALQVVPSGTFCIAAFYSHKPVPFALSIIAICLIMITMSILIYCYSSIFLKFLFRKKPESSLTESQKEPKDPNKWKIAISSNDLIVFKKCAAISLSFLILWGFELCCIFTEFWNEMPLQPVYSAIAATLAVIHTFLDPILIVHFDAKLRRDIYELLGLEGQIRSLTSENGPVRVSLQVEAERPNLLATVKLNRD